MSEELNTPQVAPAESAAPVAATPVVPEPIPAPEPPTVTPEPAAAEQAQPSEPVPAEEKKEEIPDPPAEIPVPETKEEITVPDELVEKAIELIKSTGRSSSVFLQRSLSIEDMAHVEALLDELVIKGVLGERKDPKNPMSARKILIEVSVAAPVIKVRPKPANKQGRPRVTDFDRMQMWKKHLAEIGGYKSEALIEGIAQFAQKNPGFNPQAKWGSCLIVMVNRFSGKCRDSLRTFSVTDAEYMMREMLRFMTEQPLGDGPQVWNTKFQTNMEQRNAVSEFWGINKKFAEMRGKQCSVMTAVRDAAWPTREEESKGTGGSYAERLHYLVMCLVSFGSSDHFNDLIEPALHTEPTDRFLERVGGRPRPSAHKAPDWYRDGKCLECGFDVTTDSKGNTVCSNPICMKHFAMVTTSFNNEVAPSEDAPAAPAAPRPSKNWKKHDRHDRDGEDMRGFQRKGGNKGKRYRVRDDDDDGIPSNDGNEPVASVGGNGEGFANTPFANLTLPTAPAPESQE